ncbi:hypothetical protein NQ315_008956 [Exocentrus adspersus]|uniref:DDE Tnp4 domain-containing protein n=1 Tax=Exocentrus adspersus TaxID=1586481 RepID=A0AAV8VIJ9_9CUCU|nr:hypothetical protein NQ315_008956 [Exocentrus adspersus]
MPIQKEDTVMRSAISSRERLSSTLRFLATGRNYEDLKFSNRISAQALGKIIPETSKAIFDVLQNEYCKFPESQEEWENIGLDFDIRWQFPNCLGVVNGKHIRMIPPPVSGSYYINYKHFHSIVLMGIANSNYEFILFDVGTNGRVSDCCVINNTSFYKALVAGKLLLPPINNLNDLPYVFIGDEAFALRKDFLKPYSEKELNTDRSNYNKHLCRARRIIENVFGILANRFRIFHTEIGISVKNTETVVMAACALHDFLRKKNPNYCGEISENENASINESIMTPLQKGHGSRRCIDDAKRVRELFVEYFKNN